MWFEKFSLSKENEIINLNHRILLKVFLLLIMEIIKYRKYIKSINKYLFTICLLLSMITFLLLWYNLENKSKSSIDMYFILVISYILKLLFVVRITNNKYFRESIKTKHRIKPSFLPQQIHIAIASKFENIKN
jgi:hypothetical protein